MKREETMKNIYSMEVGGFFEFPEFDCKEYKNSVLYYLENSYKNYCFFRDGRQAIKAVLLHNIEKVKNKYCYLPSYLCYSILQPFQELKLKVVFYKHGYPLKPKINKDIKNSLIFILDYFGTEPISNKEIYQFLDKNNIVILDITHSIFDKSRFKIKNKNLYLISSLRKMFSVPDGSILFHSNSELKIKKSFPRGYKKMLKAMTLKNLYFKKAREGTREKNKKIKNYFRGLYKNYEKDKDNHLILQDIPDISLKILKNIDITNIFRRRVKNLKFMYKKISDKKLFLFNFKTIKSPFTLPLIFKDEKEKNSIKETLIENNIYPLIHWDFKNIVPKDYSEEHKLRKRILSIPIDQRYDEKDLSKAINILNKILIYQENKS
ncbi:MAG: hypothetical protein WC306_00095 [Candidatus Paceibacterota bacterium]|jgi:hypothetical protein